MDISFLVQVELFRGLPREALVGLADRAKIRRFGAGSELMRQGDVSDFMYVIVNGRVRVERSHPDLRRPLVLAELGPGEIVGEMGVLDGEPRSATITAMEDTAAMELSGDAMAEIALMYADVARALLSVVSQRLRNTDELVEWLARRPEPELRRADSN